GGDEPSGEDCLETQGRRVDDIARGQYSIDDWHGSLLKWVSGGGHVLERSCATTKQGNDDQDGNRHAKKPHQHIADAAFLLFGVAAGFGIVDAHGLAPLRWGRGFVTRKRCSLPCRRAVIWRRARSR